MKGANLLIDSLQRTIQGNRLIHNRIFSTVEIVQEPTMRSINPLQGLIHEGMQGSSCRVITRA